MPRTITRSRTMPVPRPRSAMRKIREILRLALGEGLSRRQVAAATGVPASTVADHLARARRAGLGWPLPDDLDDARLEARLFAPARRRHRSRPPVPDWAAVHRELRRKGVTLQLLWLEYRERHPDGFGYSWFCHAYRTWQGRLDLVMRQEHRAGEKLFVDFAGQTLPIVDPDTGEVWQAQLFVAVLGAGSYTYAEAFASQSLPDWIAAHVHAFTFFEGYAGGGCQEASSSRRASRPSKTRWRPSWPLAAASSRWRSGWGGTRGWSGRTCTTRRSIRSGSPGRPGGRSSRCPACRRCISRRSLRHLGALGVRGQLLGPGVERLDLLRDGEVLVGDGAVGDAGVDERHASWSGGRAAPRSPRATCPG